ncbi:MAG: 2,3-bisphosphoglycerate-independent phosphoglycerate mutase [Planctomycetes bacterium]|nr:2,3-bisphosphoglycerate-independent phosphoglycerate mutase [Planctomycetota bacterium]
MIHPKTRELVQSPQDKKIILLVLDGLGGLPHPQTGLTELETARLPNLHRLAARSSGGRMLVVEPGVTPGSGPAHLALFGYHPYEVEFGRGALEALGSEFELEPGDLAARANYATIDERGIVLDRRAARPSDEENRRLCGKLAEGLKARFHDAQVFILPGKEHRFTVVFRGPSLDAALNDNDPQREGRPLLDVLPERPEAEHAATVVGRFLDRAFEVLVDEPKANGMLLRGFSGLPRVVPFGERYGLRAGAIAAYPMYRGVARLVGMTVLGSPKSFEEEVAFLEARYGELDFFFVHFKHTDTAGHSGDFAEKVQQLETVDAVIPRFEALGPEVLIVTGDHSTPCIHKEHSWHPVPTILRSPLALWRGDAKFTERGLMAGDLGVFHATDLMPLALAHASRLSKFGA